MFGGSGNLSMDGSENVSCRGLDSVDVDPGPGPGGGVGVGIGSAIYRTINLYIISLK